eukprot:1413486-Pleurochrysis_carterae.AAC.1
MAASASTAADTKAVQELLASAGLRLKQPSQPVKEEGPSSRSLQDKLVFDMACGHGQWSLRLISLTTEYLEQEEADAEWSACVSTILRITWSKQQHEETGTGCARQSSKEAAIDVATERATESACKRLARRFACSFEREQIQKLGSRTLTALGVDRHRQALIANGRHQSARQGIQHATAYLK